MILGFFTNHVVPQGPTTSKVPETHSQLCGISKGIPRSLSDGKNLWLTRGRKDPGRGWQVQGPQASFLAETQTQRGVGHGLRGQKGQKGTS